MKRILSVFFVFICVLTTATPAFAEEKQETVGSWTKRIKEEYGITVLCEASVKRQAGPYLLELEKALISIGQVFTKKLVKHYESENKTFEIDVVPFPKKYSSQSWIQAMSYNSSAPGSKQRIELFVKSKMDLTYTVIVHEFGHMLEDIVGYGEILAINGGEKSYDSPRWDPTRYATQYAMTDGYEDFAETFAYMATKQKDAAAFLKTLEETSLLYKKYIYMQAEIDDFCGSKSRITKRAATFMGEGEDSNSRP